MSYLGDLIIKRGPFNRHTLIYPDLADQLRTAAAVNELRDELIQLRRDASARPQSDENGSGVLGDTPSDSKAADSLSGGST